MKEIFKRVKLGGAIYVVSNFGTISSVDRTIKFIRNGTLCKKKYKGMTIKPSISRIGCYGQVIHDNIGNGYSKYCHFHLLVAKAFVPNPKKLPHIKFIDGNRLNPRASNLQWHYWSGGKPVINTQTKKIFKSAKIAYKSFKPAYGYQNFLCKLEGRNPNNSPFIFHKDYKENTTYIVNPDLRNNRNNGGIAVINKKTKEIFESAKKAYGSLSYNYSYKTFMRKLNGEKSNDTPFKYHKK